MRGTSRGLNEYLESCLKRALDELAGLQPDLLLSENADVLVAALLSKDMPTPINVDWDAPTRTPVTEVMTEVRDRIYDDGSLPVQASKVVVSFAASGTWEMLDYQASTFIMSGNHGRVTAGRVEVDVIARNLDAEAVRAEIHRVRGSVQQRANWANAISPSSW